MTRILLLRAYPPLCYQFAALLLVLAFLAPATSNAEIFKCVAKNGELTYSQAPCPEEDSKVTVVKSGSRSSSEPADCEHARRFALDTAQRMKSGTESIAIFDGYGGLGALSKGSVGLISYVYQFRTDDDTSAVRVSALATAKCRAKSFGDVSCEQLPASFTNRLGGCNKDEDDDGHSSADANDADGKGAQVVHVQDFGRGQVSNSSQSTNTSSSARNREAKAIEEEKRLECRARIKSQIDSINARMRSGYTYEQGKSLKKSRRDLEAKDRDC